jgi:hypothetical protein
MRVTAGELLVVAALAEVPITPTRDRDRAAARNRALIF